MAQYLKDFKNGFNGGTRANRFEIIGSWPNGVQPKPPTIFHAYAGSIPASVMGTITVPYRGRNCFFAGDREFQPWTITIYDDTGNRNLWKAFQQWSSLLNKHETNKVAYEQFAYRSDELWTGSPLLTTWTVKQLNECNDVLKTIDLLRCWPAVVSEIPLDMGNGNPVSFQVTMSFDYMKIRNL